MARKLDNFPAAAGARYPWDEWLDGGVWELVSESDYTSKTSTFRANVLLQAKKRSGRARSKIVSVDGREALVIQFERA